MDRAHPLGFFRLWKKAAKSCFFVIFSNMSRFYWAAWFTKNLPQTTHFSDLKTLLHWSLNHFRKKKILVKFFFFGDFSVRKSAKIGKKSAKNDENMKSPHLDPVLHQYSMIFMVFMIFRTEKSPKKKNSQKIFFL